MRRLNVYDQIKLDINGTQTQSRLRLHSDSLPRVDHGLENWTTEVKLNQVEHTQPVFSSDVHYNGLRDHTKGGGRVLPHKGSD